MLSIALLDDLQLSRQGIKCLLEEWYYDVIITASDGIDLLEKLIESSARPDICIINLVLDENNHLEPVLYRVIEKYPLCTFVYINDKFLPKRINKLFENRIVVFSDKHVDKFKKLLLGLGRLN